MVTVTSLVMANAFDRPHGQILQTIGELLGGRNQHFQCRDLAGDPMYRLTRAAFVMLVATFISFSDRKARVETLYLNAFDILEGDGKPDAKIQLPDLPARPTRLAAPSRGLIIQRSAFGNIPVIPHKRAKGDPTLGKFARADGGIAVYGSSTGIHYCPAKT